MEIYLQKAVTNANVSPSDFRYREFSVFFFFLFLIKYSWCFHTRYKYTRKGNARVKRVRAACERRD